MIYINRIQPSAQFKSAATLGDKDLAKHMLKTKARVILQEGITQLLSPNFIHIAEREVTKAFHSKCVYCETRLHRHLKGKLEFFRPIINAVGLDGKVSTYHYWWLAHNWNNLYYSCPVCSSSKANHFPVIGSRSPTKSPFTKILQHEKPFLIDPCHDDPSEHIDFDRMGRVTPKTKRGDIAIEILELNRRELCDRRAQAADYFLSLLPFESTPLPYAFRFDFVSHLSDQLSVRSEFAGMKRQLLAKESLARDYSSAEDFILKTVGPEAAKLFAKTSEHDPSHTISKPQLTSKQKYRFDTYRESMSQLARLEIVNFRVIEHLDLAFPPQLTEEEPWLVLIGENGVGKSSILKALALLFATESTRRKLVSDARTCVRKSAKSGKGFVRAWFSHQPNEPVELHFNKGSQYFRILGKVPRIPMLGYGATRLPPGPNHNSITSPRRVRIGNLFDPHEPLSDGEAYFTNTERIDSTTFSRMAAGLRKLLDLDEEVGLISRRSGKILIESGNGQIELQEQSDGYRSVTALAGDIMMNLTDKTSDLESVRGTVLIDEIGCHLHPQWRIRIVLALREVFPRVRFIATTHEPLCLRGSRDGEVYRLFRDDNTQEIIADRLDIPPGLTADQLLTGQWFGLSSTLDHATADLMEEHFRLLAQSRKSNTAKARQLEIENDLRRRLGTFADTSLEGIVRNVMASLVKAKGGFRQFSATERKSLQEQVLRLSQENNKLEQN